MRLPGSSAKSVRLKLLERSGNRMPKRSGSPGFGGRGDAEHATPATRVGVVVRQRELDELARLEADRRERLEAELPDRRREPAASHQVEPDGAALSEEEGDQVADQQRELRRVGEDRRVDRSETGTGSTRRRRRTRRATSAASGAGGRVRGSLSMKPAKNQIGDDTSAKLSAVWIGVPAMTTETTVIDTPRRPRRPHPAECVGCGRARAARRR